MVTTRSKWHSKNKWLLIKMKVYFWWATKILFNTSQFCYLSTLWCATVQKKLKNIFLKNLNVWFMDVQTSTSANVKPRTGINIRSCFDWAWLFKSNLHSFKNCRQVSVFIFSKQPKNNMVKLTCLDSSLLHYQSPTSSCLRKKMNRFSSISLIFLACHTRS